MFYERYSELCKSIGKTTGTVAQELGVSKSASSAWKTMKRTPSAETVKKIADYFGVTTDYLLGTSDIQKDEADEMAYMLEEIRKNPELRTMFSITRNATPEQLRQYINVIKAIRGDD